MLSRYSPKPRSSGGPPVGYHQPGVHESRGGTPPDKGGWNLLHTWWLAADVSNPAVHFGMSGAGPGAWFGWPDIPELERLITDWVRATDQTKRKQLADEIQKVTLREVPYVPWGEWFQPTAYRKNVQGVLKFGAPIFWNVKIT